MNSRYLGRGLTFDDAYENCYISRETFRRFFHEFIKVGSDVLFQKYVKFPTAPEEIKSCRALYEMAGLDGAIGSTDATHVVVEKLSSNLKQNHKGGKSSMTTRSFNLTVDHTRRIIGCAPSAPGRWNDKTLQIYDPVMVNIHEGKLLKVTKLYACMQFFSCLISSRLIIMNNDTCMSIQNETFTLMYKDKHGAVKSALYQGAWLLVDNGYLKWSCCIPPMKYPVRYDEKRWSEMLESMRKDVECTFGILKGRSV